VFDIIEQKFLRNGFMDDSFGKTLRDLRLQAQVGLRELAALINKSPGYLSDVELDRVPPPSEAMILDIAKALDVNKKDLLKAAKKVDPELSEYVVDQPMAADFLRMAKDHEFGKNDWERLSQLAKISRLGKLNKGEE
jgi:transcriptional regulator with XRE-family HTH domain